MLDILDDKKKNGGNVIKSSVRLNVANYESTMKDIEERLLKSLKLIKSEYSVIGSTGKRVEGSYGDLDIAISKDSLDINHLGDCHAEYIEDIVLELNYEYHLYMNNQMIHIAWPIINDDGCQPDSVVQLDIMLVDDLEWSTWMYYSPAPDESNWKGLYRNYVLFALAKYTDFLVLVAEGKEIITWEKYTFNMLEGFYAVRQTRFNMKTGKILKNHKNVFRALLTRDPNEALNYLFDNDVKKEDVLTFEQIIELLKKGKSKFKDYDFIRLKIAHELEQNGWIVPQVLE